MRTQCASLTQSGLTLALLFSAIGCGGGITSALSLGSEGSSLNGISVTNGEATKNVSTTSGSAASGNGAVTISAFSACPSEEMSPADMKKLGCIVGRYEGARFNEKWVRIGPANEKCYLTLLSDGRMTISIPGVFDRQHQFSHVAATVDTADASTYRYINKGGNVLGASETWPTIFLESKFAGSGAIKWADYFALMLSQANDGAAGSMYAWVADSTLNDQVERCGGQLALPSTSSSRSSPSAQSVR